MRDRLFAAGLVLAAVAPALAQAPAQPPAAQQDQQKAEEQDPDRPITITEQVIVSASRTEQELVNAPATVSVVTNETIQNSPATNMGDLLRSVPGLNVTQVSARDINLTSRGATGTLATSQLALVDGRSIYLDFFGMVMWDLVPTNLSEIRQIEVIRGPASAVWGANAMTGVVNVITRSPRELAADGGTSVTIGVGAFERSAQGVDRGTGTMFYVNGSHAQAVNDRWAYKLSAGYLTQDPLPRPTGTIPNAAGTAYPAYENVGTSQPKFDARVDYDFENTARLTFSGGVAGTEGIIHSGIGPFNIDNSSRLSYFTARYQQGGRRVAFFTNILQGNAENLLSRAATPTAPFLPLDFDTKTFDIEASDLRTIGTRHALSFGGNYRRNTFEISIAPEGADRNEGGAYVQDEIFFGDHFRWVVGGRVDKFSSIDDAVFSPRTSLLIKPSASQTFRISFNRAFRAPSFINNHIDVALLNEANLSAISPALSRYVFPIRAIGNTALEEETMTAVELGYTGVLARRATLTAAVYWNTIDDAIFFTQIGRYGAANAPPGWPLPPVVLELIPSPGLPSLFSYRNLGKVKDKGFEIGVDTSVNEYVNVFTNYSYQADPDVEGFDPRETNFPANNRFNAGVNFSASRYLGNLAVNYTDEAYWQDVLDLRYAGPTEAYTLVNAAFGVRWAGERIVTSVKFTNLLNEEVQQHVFGDILKRQVAAELRVTF
jgi:iron complex outermembrane receptor protein